MKKLQETLKKVNEQDSYVVTIFDKNKGTRANYTNPMPKAKADATAKLLANDMKIAIPKYQFAKDIKVEPVKK